MISPNTSTSCINQCLQTAAQFAQIYYQSEYGISYSTDDFVKAFEAWLNASVEELAQEAFAHCVSKSDRATAFNRSAFTDALKQTSSIEVSVCD